MVLDTTIIQPFIKKSANLKVELLVVKTSDAIPKDAKTVSVGTPYLDDNDNIWKVRLVKIKILRGESEKNKGYDRAFLECPVCEQPQRRLFYPLSFTVLEDTWMCDDCVCENVPVEYAVDEQVGYLWDMLKPRSLYKSCCFNGKSFKNAVYQIEKVLVKVGIELTPEQKDNLYDRKYIGEEAKIEFFKLLSDHAIYNTNVGRTLRHYWILRNLIINKFLTYNKFLKYAARQDLETFNYVCNLYMGRKPTPEEEQELVERFIKTRKNLPAQTVAEDAPAEKDSIVAPPSEEASTENAPADTSPSNDGDCSTLDGNPSNAPEQQLSDDELRIIHYMQCGLSLEQAKASAYLDQFPGDGGMDDPLDL